MRGVNSPPNRGIETDERSGEDRAGQLVRQTLAEQLRITAHEIESRKRLLDFSDADTEALRACRRHIHSRIDTIVDEFYALQTREPEIALVIGDVETLGRLQHAMRGYIMDIFEGVYDSDYVNKRLRIGKIHNRIGVSPKLYTSAVRLLHRLLVDEIRSIPGQSDEVESIARYALHKVLMFDVQLVFDTYIASLVAEVEERKRMAERYATALEDQVFQRTQELERYLRTDVLTGLTNQRGFYEHLHRECAASLRSAAPLVLMFIDLDGFKTINDTLGHQAGDAILRTVGEFIADSVRESDITCRYGGDEFAVIMPRTAASDVHHIVRRITESRHPDLPETLTLSIGIAETTTKAKLLPDDLIGAADAAMYRAKDKSRYERNSHFEIAAPAGVTQAAE